MSVTACLSPAEQIGSDSLGLLMNRETVSHTESVERSHLSLTIAISPRKLAHGYPRQSERAPQSKNFSGTFEHFSTILKLDWATLVSFYAYR
jgi:hypothetical protein